MDTSRRRSVRCASSYRGVRMVKTNGLKSDIEHTRSRWLTRSDQACREQVDAAMSCDGPGSGSERARASIMLSSMYPALKVSNATAGGRGRSKRYRASHLARVWRRRLSVRGIWPMVSPCRSRQSRILRTSRSRSRPLLRRQGGAAGGSCEVLAEAQQTIGRAGEVLL
jgi:hypothetical protein